MKVKRLLLITALLVAITLSVFAQGNAEQSVAAKLTLRLGHPVAANSESDVHVAAEKFAEYVNANSKNVEVKIYPSGQLGNERDQMEGLQLGTLDLRAGGTAIMANLIKQFGILDLPYVWRDYEHFHKVIDGEVGTTLALEAEKVGVKVLGWFDSWGFRHVLSAKKVEKPSDLKGMKIRCIETPTNIAAIEVMAANPTPMPFGEVYTSLQTGVIDGMEHSSAVILANNFQEVAKNIALTGHLFGPLVMNMSMKSWNKLSVEDQKIVMDGGKIAADYARSLTVQKEQNAFEALKKQGVVVKEIDVSTFREGAKAFNTKYAKDVDATGLLKIILETK